MVYRGGQVIGTFVLARNFSNAIKPGLYAAEVLDEISALNSLDTSFERVAREMLLELVRGPSLLMVPIDETFPTVYER